MFAAFKNPALLAASMMPAMAGTVVITSLPDDGYSPVPLSSLNGEPLAIGAEVTIGAFPGMSDDAILDEATQGLDHVASKFVAFGAVRLIGDGVAGEAGNFEIAQRQAVAAGSPWVGEEVTLLIRKNGGQEFLIARFKGKVFAADPDTGLEPLLSLHLSDAKLLVGNRNGAKKFSTSPVPERGSYLSWIGGFPQLVDEDQRRADADPDGDGRSNFLEYASGGNPASPADAPPCRIKPDEQGGLWISFSQVVGLGAISYQIEANPDLVSPWQLLEGDPVPDPTSLPADTVKWSKLRVPVPLSPAKFFRLKVE